ncbi:MAG: hypothetical protein JO222_06740 [Frankiales bacterium]|nr:hypothetical protein [Frankiales bacterium]
MTAGCTGSASHHAHQSVARTPSKSTADFRAVTPPSLHLPGGFHIEAALRFARLRTDLLTLRGNSLFWFDHRTSEDTSGLSTYHRIERLDLRTLKLTTVFQSKTPLTGFETWPHGLVVAEYLPSRGVGCAPQCVQAVVGVIDLQRQPPTHQVVARSDPQPLASAAGIGLLAWPRGVIFQLVQHGRHVLETWRWRTGSVAAVRSDRVESIDFDAVGDVLVGQHVGSRGLWAASLTRKPPPELPLAARTRGLLGATQGSRLIWAEQPGTGTRETAYATILRKHRFGRPKKLFASEIYVLQPLGRCLLALRSPSGLFAADSCEAVAPMSRLLTADQSSVIYNPARFAAQPGRLVFALAPGRTQGSETLVILRTPAV